MAFFGRSKNKIQNPYTIQDIYKQYISDKKESDLYFIDYITYRNIVLEYFKQIETILFDQSLDFKLPNNLGSLQIVKKRRDVKLCGFLSSTIDWGTTNKYGQRIHYTNEHSEGYRYYFMWKKNRALKNISKYRFVPTRANKRKLAYYIKNKVRDYFEVN